ncbi:MAG: branched-chain amino acid ABC transporter permease [Desulfitobacteriaceae bacterium]
MSRIKRLLFWAVILGAGLTLEFLGRFEIIDGYVMQIIELVGINIILVASLNLINGFLGEFAIGHAGFMALGAYVSAIGTVKFHLPFAIAFLAGGLMTALAAYLIGIPAFKTFGDYLAIITLGFNMIIVNLLNNIDYVGGPRGMVGLPKSTNFIWVFATVLLTLLILRNLVYSNFGRVWVAIRENTIAAEMMGVNIYNAKLKAFALAGFFAGLAGALWGHMLQYINPSSFTYLKSTDMLIMLYLGGLGSLTGSVLGATLMTGLLEVLRGFGVWRMVISPLILLVIMLTRPLGLLGNKEPRFVVPKEPKLAEEVPTNAPVAR